MNGEGGSSWSHPNSNDTTSKFERFRPILIAVLIVVGGICVGYQGDSDGSVTADEKVLSRSIDPRVMSTPDTCIPFRDSLDEEENPFGFDMGLDCA